MFHPDAIAPSFDCIELDDGGLRLIMPDRHNIVLTREQRNIVALELKAPTR